MELPRDTPRWRKLYRGRAAVEREPFPSRPKIGAVSRADRDPGRNPEHRPGEKRACSRKKRRSKIDAQLYAEKHGDLKAYKCRFCSGWHVAKKTP